MSITRKSKVIRVLSTIAVRGSEGTAAVVTLRQYIRASAAERSNRHLCRGHARQGGLREQRPRARTELLTSIALDPGARADQLGRRPNQRPSSAARVRAKVGEGSVLASNPPALVVRGAHLADDPGGGTDAEGTVVNQSGTDQGELVIYAVARRGNRIVAAGRAALETLAAGSSAPFQLFFVGNPGNAQLQFTAAATAPG